MKQSAFRLVVAILTLSLLLTACGAPQAAAGGTIKIGGSLCLTGIQAPLDEPAVRGAQLAVDYINSQGGVLGKKLEFINLDGKSDPVTVGNNGVQLVQEGVVAIIAPSDFDFGGPASREAQKAGIVGISPTGLFSALWIGHPRRQAVHDVHVEHDDGSGRGGICLQSKGLPLGLRRHRYVHRLHQIPQPLLHRSLQAPGRHRDL